MRKKNRNLFLLVMMMAVIWLGAGNISASTTIPTDVETASSNCTLLGVKGEYITQIPQALKRINEIRKEACQEGVLNPRTGSPLKPSDYVPIKCLLILNILQESVRRSQESQWHTKEQMAGTALK